MAELARVQFEYTPRDAIAAAMHGYDLSPLVQSQVRRARFWIVLVGLPLCLAVGISLTLVPKPIPTGAAGLIAMMLMACPVAWAIVYDDHARRRYRRAVETGLPAASARGLLGPYRVVITDAGIEAGTASAILTATWDVVTGITDTPRCVFIHVAGFMVPLPREAFASDQELESFLQPIRRRMRDEEPTGLGS